jgi:hypothetical protein
MQGLTLLHMKEFRIIFICLLARRGIPLRIKMSSLRLHG